KVTLAMQDWLDRCTSKSGRRHVAVKVIQELGCETAALITSKAIIDHLSTKITVMSMAQQIAKMMLDELRFRKFEREAPGLFNWKLRQFNTSSYAHMKRSL